MKRDATNRRLRRRPDVRVRLSRYSQITIVVVALVVLGRLGQGVRLFRCRGPILWALRGFEPGAQPFLESRTFEDAVRRRLAQFLESRCASQVDPYIFIVVVLPGRRVLVRFAFVVGVAGVLAEDLPF